MTPQELIGAFETFADAPDGTKRLREMVLQLAVQGKLVDQDPSDEPASVLLERITAEKEKLLQEKKIKKSKPLPPIEADEVPFEVPAGWEWCRLSDTCDVRDGTHDTPKYVSEGIPLVTSKNLSSGALNLTGSKFISVEDHEEISRRSKVDQGDILFAMIGSIGNPVLVDISETFSIKNVALFKPYRDSLVYFSYLHKYLILASEMMRNTATGAVQKFVSLGFLRGYLLPLPPQAEQHRIVAKVDELMALLDRLEAARDARDKTRAALRDSSLSALRDADEPQALTTSWTRIQDNMDHLLQDPSDVAPLRQAILQLAVRGRLVPQDPNDEPASVLLERIAVEKEKLVQEKKIKKSKPLPPIEADEVPFEVPAGWEWCRLSLVCSLITKGSSPKWQGVAYVEPPAGILFVTSENVGAGELKLAKRKHVEEKFNQVEPRSILMRDDVLLNIVGASIGRAAIFDIEDLANINQAVCLLRTLVPSFGGANLYLLNYLNSELARSQMFNKQVDNARANLSMGNIAKFLLPLPPTAEQHRIVAKVDELMALCDDLEARLTQAKSTRGAFAAAASASLNSGSSSSGAKPKSTQTKGQGGASKHKASSKKDAAAKKPQAPAFALTPPELVPSKPKAKKSAATKPINGRKTKQKRKPKGASRQFHLPVDEVATDEVMALFRKALRGHTMERDDLIKEVSVLMGYGRLSQNVATVLEKHLRTAIRRGVVEKSEPSGMRIATPSISDYSDDYLVESLERVLRKRCTYAREDVMESLAHFAGFRRITNKVEKVLRSVINKGIRRGFIERDGQGVRRD